MKPTKILASTIREHLVGLSTEVADLAEQQTATNVQFDGRLARLETIARVLQDESQRRQGGHAVVAAIGGLVGGSLVSAAINLLGRLHF